MDSDCPCGNFKLFSLRYLSQVCCAVLWVHWSLPNKNKNKTKQKQTQAKRTEKKKQIPSQDTTEILLNAVLNITNPIIQ
jgi:hypothetical protein